ncbi:alkaline shock response membrane anchor protein AmaP [Brevibacillus sp. SYSU BS000544]|uniref:alkaline shock response membrane anchor protein AmaP n=1 Tax=Brevibacillus sp. SYSU BS000544 TaxID=3416443 RepID=UPI003CE50F60
MNLFDRFILTLYSFALLVISFLVLAVMLQLVPLDIMYQLHYNITTPGYNLPYIIAVVIFILISFRFFLTAFTSGKKKKDDKAIYSRSDIGEISISLSTIRSITERVAHKIKGVRELKTIVSAKDMRNTITLLVTVDGETPIPDMTAKLQADVKTQVEAITGIEIAEVAVKVTEVAPINNAPSVRRRVE